MLFETVVDISRKMPHSVIILTSDQVTRRQRLEIDEYLSLLGNRSSSADGFLSAPGSIQVSNLYGSRMLLIRQFVYGLS